MNEEAKGTTDRSDPEDALAAWRSEFPILERKTYLNSCSLGALSHRSEARLREFTERWHGEGAAAWYGPWLERLAELRARVAAFLGGVQGSVALLPSTSSALSVIAESLSYEERPRVVTTELDFPTLAYQWTVKPEVDLVILESPDGVGVREEQFAEAVDGRTAVLATSHVFFTTGFVQEIGALAEIAHRRGALCLIDGYHGAGQLPADVQEAGIDVYTGGPLKWLCGGPGLAYLYVRPELHGTLHPRITGWFGAANAFDFEIGRLERHDDARRFEMGTPALPTVHTALGGQEIVEEVGIGRIAAHNRRLTERLVAGCREAGFTLTTAADPARRSAIVMVRHPEPAAAVESLASEGIVVDHRPGHVRVSPHFYNTGTEVDCFVEALAATRISRG